MSDKTKISGVDDLVKALADIGNNLTQPLNDASRAALRPMLATAKANAPVKTGTLRKSLVIRRQPGSPKNTANFTVAPNAKSPAARYAHIVEMGGAPHFDGKHLHPGARAHPFLAPAFVEHQAGAVKLFAESIGPAIEKRAAKLAKKRGGS